MAPLPRAESSTVRAIYAAYEATASSWDSIPDCDDPDKVDWVGRDATSLSMAITGEGVLASESVDTWIEGFESIESIPAKIEWEFPAKTITWTGRVHIESMEVGANNGERATNNVSLQSDGVMTRVTTPATP